jgi:broad specificity phosphatase PhoE
MPNADEGARLRPCSATERSRRALSSSSTRLILIRHAESVANLEGRFTRHGEEPLTALGRQQAVERARRLAEICRPRALYASPFRRALETAAVIGRALDLEPEIEEDLREQDFGIYRGRPYAEFYGRRSVERWEHLPAGGEKLRQVAERAGRVLDRIARTHVGQEVLVVSHGAVMAALRGWIASDYSQPPVSTANVGGYVLVYDGRQYAEPVDVDQASAFVERGETV